MKRGSSRRPSLPNVKTHLPSDYAWKVLGSLTDDLCHGLTSEEYETVKTIVRARSFEQLSTLTEAWGAQSINSCDISVESFFAKYQVASLLKKFQFPTDRKSRKAAALKKFIAAEDACRVYNYSNPTEDLGGWKLQAFSHAYFFLHELLGDVLPEREKLTEWSRHGPGSNLDTKKGCISLYDKYKNWPYSCTVKALGHARLAIQDDERWLGALEDSYRERNDIPKHAILNQDAFWSSVLKPVPGNRITFVPKNSQTDRSIAIEPCMNLYLQLGVDGFIRRRLRRWGVDLDDQSKNQLLAREGSRNWESSDPFVTLDLAAASDTISLQICRLLLPSQWYNYLLELRSPSGECEGEIISYEKISSMGNGFTFALESALFTALIVGVYRTFEHRCDSSEFAVFGDDLIVRRRFLEPVVEMLNWAGFSINHEKSFTQGPFRESCGADWFGGIPVRPVFLTEIPNTVNQLWCDINRLRRVLYLRRWMISSKTSTLLERWIPPVWKDFIGPISDEEFDTYLHASRPAKPAKHGFWGFSRLIFTNKTRSGNEFLFRKLMHQLRQGPEPTSKWSLDITQGRRFAVTRRNSFTASVQSSHTSYWCDEYTDTLPIKP